MFERQSAEGEKVVIVDMLRDTCRNCNASLECTFQRDREGKALNEKRRKTSSTSS